MYSALTNCNRTRHLVYLCCYKTLVDSVSMCCFFFQAEDGIRDLVRSGGLGDVYKRQALPFESPGAQPRAPGAQYGVGGQQ